MDNRGDSPLVGTADNALLRILLVEDAEDDYVIIRDLLSEIGEEFELEWVADYDTALQAIEREEHDVCLLDYHLGEHSGLDLLREAAQKGYKAPMILLTGQGDREVDLEAMRAGATDYLVKGQIDTPLLERSIRYGLARTLKALGESERRFRSLVQSGSDIITIVDGEGRIRYESPSVERVLGYRPEDLVGREAFDHVHPDDLERVRSVFVEVTRSSGVSAPVEVRIRHADGSWRCIEAVANNLLDEPTVKGIVVNSRDVTERKRAEEALRRREAILQAVSFAAALFLKRTASWEESIREVLKALGRATQVSRVYIFENYTGEDGTLFTKQRYEWVTPGIKPEIDNPALQALSWRDAGFGRWLETLSQGQPIYGPVRNFPDSEQYELKAEGIQSIAVVPIFVEQEWRGHIGFDACLAERDWSAAEIEALRAAAATLGAAVQRNRTEEALRQSEARFRRLVEQAADALFVHDLEGRFVEVNQQACDSLGYTQEELLTMSVADIEENLDPQGLVGLWKRIASEGPVTINGVHRRKDGTRFPVEVRIGLFETGEDRLMLVAARDITERKAAEKELARLASFPELNPNPVIEMALSGDLTYVNTAAERLFPELRELGRSHPILNGLETSIAKLRAVHEGSLVDEVKIGNVFYQRVISYVPGNDLVRLYAIDTTERKQTEEALRESEERYRAVVQQAAEGMFVVDLETRRIFEANAAYRELLGYDAEEMLELTLYDVVAHDPESVDVHVQRIVDEGNHVIGERQHRRRDGSLVEVEAGASLISYGGRSVMSVVVHDVTERKRAERELRKSEARNRAILEATPDLMFRVSRDGEYLDFRAKDDSKLFIPREEIVGKTLRETMPPDLAGPMLRQVAKTLDTGEMQTFDYQLPVADGMLDFEARLVVSGPGEVLSIVRDVTERKALERSLEHQAFHDALTGLPNRALFLDRLEHALSRSGRRQESVTVLFIDLDNFKVINDSLGHDAGDELLVAVAVRLQECLRAEDTLARLGGDEFTILIEDLEDTSHAINVAERVAQALQKPFVLRGQEVLLPPALVSLSTILFRTSRVACCGARIWLCTGPRIMERPATKCSIRT